MFFEISIFVLLLQSLYYLFMIKGNGALPFYSLPLSSVVGTRVVSLAWNPCDPVCLSFAISSGDLCLIKVKDNSVDFSNKNGIGAR